MLKGYINNERGVSLILLGLSIIVLFGFGALAIDIAKIYNVKNEMQVAADAAALAGANSLGGPFDTTQTAARQAAFRIGLMNTAGVADTNIPSYSSSDTTGCTFPGVNAGQPLPVVLNTLQANANIQVGYWAGNTFNPGATPVNAVMVTASRTGAYGYQPRVATWFAKIFALLGTRFDFTNVAAQAVAAKEAVKLVPIMVNEYWMSDSSGPNSTGRPYDATVHNYPSSFVRKKEVAGWDFGTNSPKPQTVDSPAYGYTFAILGSQANGNIVSNSPNGYADMNYRSDYYFGGPIVFDPKKSEFMVNQQIYTATDASGDCSTLCSSYFTGPSGSFSDTSEKSKSGVDYLVDGYPSTRLPPTAIYEILRATNSLYTTSTDTFASITSAYNTRYNLPVPPDTNCPHAMVSFFDTSGSDPISFNANKAAGKVGDYYPQGSRFMALVYDGTHTTGALKDFPPNFNKSSMDTNLLTPVVGYVLIEVDGYASGGVPAFQAGNDPATIAYNKGLLSPSWSSGPGNTMYGHAVDDIIQPDPSSPRGGCDFINLLRQKITTFNNVRLVKFSSQRYGLKTEQNP